MVASENCCREIKYRLCSRPEEIRPADLGLGVHKVEKKFLKGRDGSGKIGGTAATYETEEFFLQRKLLTTCSPSTDFGSHVHLGILLLHPSVKCSMKTEMTVRMFWIEWNAPNVRIRSSSTFLHFFSFVLLMETTVVTMEDFLSFFLSFKISHLPLWPTNHKPKSCLLSNLRAMILLTDDGYYR